MVILCAGRLWAARLAGGDDVCLWAPTDRKSTRLNSSHLGISYAVFCLKKKKCDAFGPAFFREEENQGDCGVSVRIMYSAQCHPLLCQLIAYHLFELCLLRSHVFEDVI